MRLNVINNYKTIYYNFLASFYLCLNCVLPYYDDVIISIQSRAIKLLIDNESLNLKKIKKIRMIEFIDTLHKSDKIILDKEKDIIVVDYCIYEEEDSDPEARTEKELATDTTDSAGTDNDSGRASSDTSEPDRDPYEPRKKKSRIDNDYTPQPTGPIKDKDDYYNMGVYAVSSVAAAVSNNAAKYLTYDSGSNSADTTDTVDTVDTVDTADSTDDGDGGKLDNEIDASISNVIKHIIYDKNKDD